MIIVFTRYTCQSYGVIIIGKKERKKKGSCSQEKSEGGGGAFEFSRWHSATLVDTYITALLEKGNRGHVSKKL